MFRVVGEGQMNGAGRMGVMELTNAPRTLSPAAGSHDPSLSAFRLGAGGRNLGLQSHRHGR